MVILFQWIDKLIHQLYAVDTIKQKSSTSFSTNYTPLTTLSTVHTLAHHSHPLRLWDRTCHSPSPVLCPYLFSSSHGEPANMWCFYLCFFWGTVGWKWMFPATAARAALVSLTGSHTRKGGFYCHVRYSAEPLMNHCTLGWDGPL